MRITIPAAFVVFVMMCGSAFAQVAPPPLPRPPLPPPSPAPSPAPQPDPPKDEAHGNRSKIDGPKMLTAALVCLGLNEGLDRVAHLPRPTFIRGMVRGLTCNGIAGVVPVSGVAGGLVGGLFGKVGYETLIGIDGIVTHTIDGTWRCQPNDKRPQCSIWVQQHPVHAKKSKQRKKRRRHR